MPCHQIAATMLPCYYAVERRFEAEQASRHFSYAFMRAHAASEQTATRNNNIASQRLRAMRA